MQSWFVSEGCSNAVWIASLNYYFLKKKVFYIFYMLCETNESLLTYRRRMDLEVIVSWDRQKAACWNWNSQFLLSLDSTFLIEMFLLLFCFLPGLNLTCCCPGLSVDPVTLIHLPHNGMCSQFLFFVEGFFERLAVWWFVLWYLINDVHVMLLLFDFYFFLF